MFVGLVAGLGAGALWGLTFVAPRAVSPYGEIDLAILRYFAFGITSLMLMLAFRQMRPVGFSFAQMRLAVFLGVTGYVVYYVCIAFSVRLAGPAIAPLIIGALPVLLAIVGNIEERTVAWRSLVFPLAIMTAGLAVLNAGTLALAGSATERTDITLGIALALVGLLVWVVYAVVNARALRAPDCPSALAWTCLQGVGSMIGVLPVALGALIFGWGRMADSGIVLPDATPLLVWALITGVIGSWIAQYFWTLASQRLPLALSAQLIVSETIFALLYGFAFETRWPLVHEWVGAALLVSGVALAVRAFHREPRPSVDEVGSTR
jgi:drug/metabolite transporter (DMT)-like permease